MKSVLDIHDSSERESQQREKPKCEEYSNSKHFEHANLLRSSNHKPVAAGFSLRIKLARISGLLIWFLFLIFGFWILSDIAQIKTYARYRPRRLKSRPLPTSFV